MRAVCHESVIRSMDIHNIAVQKGMDIKMKRIRKNRETSVNAGRLKGLRAFFKEEEGMGTVEIILIIVVLIGLVIIFKTQLRALVETVFEKITKDSKTVMS